MENNNQNTNNTNKDQNIFISLFLIAIFVGGLYAYSTYYKGSVLKNTDDVVGVVDDLLPAMSNCGLTLQTPTSGQSIVTTAGIDVAGVVDNSEREILGCSWTVFEAQAGVVYVKDGNGNDVAKPTPFTTIEEWMTDAPVNYFAHIDILNNYTGDALVIINEENPSGEGVSKTISLPIKITQ